MQREQPLWNRMDVVFLLFCVAFLYLHLFVLPASPVFYEEDHLIYVQDAWRMYQGEALYRDFFEFTFPGTQVVYLFLMDIFGTKFWIVNAVIFIQGLSQAVIWLAICKIIFRAVWLTYLPVSIFIFFGFRWFGIDGSHRMLSPIFIGLAILAVLKLKSYWRVVAAGVCCAFASYFTQQRGILALAAIAVFIGVEHIKKERQIREMIRQESALIAFYVFSLLAMLVPFIVTAGPSLFAKYTFGFIGNYVQDSTSNNYFAMVPAIDTVINQGALMTVVMFFYYLIIPVAYFGTFYFLWRKQYAAEIYLIALVGFLLALGTFAPTPGRLFQIALPPLTVAVWLVHKLVTRIDVVAKYAVILLVIFGSALAVRLQTNWDRTYLDTPTGNLVFLSPVQSERYKWLIDNARPGDFVFEAYEPAVNFPLQLRNPTPVTYVWDNGFTPVWQVEATIRGLEEHKPEFVIWDGKWNKPPEQRAAGDHLAPLYDYLQRHYVLEREFTDYSNRKMQGWQRTESLANFTDIK